MTIFSFNNYVLISQHRIISNSVRNLFLTGIRESQVLVKLLVWRGNIPFQRHMLTIQFDKIYNTLTSSS